MKKFLLMLVAVALMTACSEDEGDGGSGNDPINYEEGYKYLSSLNVSDAKMIYQKTSGASMKSRAAGDEDGTYYKLDLNGNESKLVIKDSIGQDHDIRIDLIVKLSDDLLLVNPNTGDIIDLIPRPEQDPDGPIADIAVDPIQYLSLVNVKTEKIYQWPKELKKDAFYYTLLESEYSIKSDNQGNIYLAFGFQTYHEIYKLDASNLTIQQILPDGQEFTDFDVTDDGFVMYWNDFTENKNYKVKCPGGRIYPITDVPFMINDELYSYKDKKIVKWETVGNNELKETEICDFEPNNPELEIHGSLNNYFKNTVLLMSNYSWYFYEFDGKHYQLRELNDFNWCENCIDNFCTNRAWYIKNNTRFYKMDMSNYQASEFQVLDYEIQSLSASPESSNITFTGIRYLDGANVVGTIDENDKITIDNVADNGEQIINLIPLN